MQARISAFLWKERTERFLYPPFSTVHSTGFSCGQSCWLLLSKAASLLLETTQPDLIRVRDSLGPTLSVVVDVGLFGMFLLLDAKGSIPLSPSWWCKSCSKLLASCLSPPRVRSESKVRDMVASVIRFLLSPVSRVNHHL